MLISLRKLGFVLAAAGFATLGLSRPASAALQIALQEAGVNGGAATVVATASDFTAASFTGTYGDFTVVLQGASSNNGANLSNLLSASTQITNNDGTGRTLTIFVTQNNYTLPTGSPLNVESGMGGSVSAGTLGLTGIFQAYADKNNNLFGTTDYTNGPQTALQTGTTFDTGSASGLFTRTGQYSLTTKATIVLSAGGTINYSAHENVTAPEPATVVMALTGLPLAGLFLARRRRR